jgi:hypothetical protein
MGLFGSRRAATKELEEFIVQLDATAKVFGQVFSLSDPQVIEFRRIQFFLFAKGRLTEPVTEARLDSTEERVLGSSFGGLVRSGGRVTVVVEWGGKLICANGEMREGSTIDFGSGGIPSSIKLIREEDIRRVARQIGDRLSKS